MSINKLNNKKNLNQMQINTQKSNQEKGNWLDIQFDTIGRKNLNQIKFLNL